MKSSGDLELDGARAISSKLSLPSTFCRIMKTTIFTALFVQDQIAIVQNKLWLTVGSKFEHNIFTGWENEPSARAAVDANFPSDNMGSRDARGTHAFPY